MDKYPNRRSLIERLKKLAVKQGIDFSFTKEVIIILNIQEKINRKRKKPW